MSQLSLLSPAASWEEIDLPDGEARLLPSLFDVAEADTLLQRLLTEVPWRQDVIRLFGREHPLPRLQQWFGDEGLDYTWSGIHLQPLPWSPFLTEIKNRVEEASGASFNTVLLNRYRSGKDTVSWHSDNEIDLGPQPVICSVSFGAERDFVLKHATNSSIERRAIYLTHGSLLLMAGETQANWLHALPRRARIAGERVNLTFRQISR